MNLVEQIGELHRRFADAAIPHAFGGALALAWCTHRARATIDIDVNLFLDSSQAATVYEALPPGIEVSPSDRAAIAQDGQTRLWWDQTPVDVFFNTTNFHQQVGTRARIETFDGQQVPFLACSDLAVFKAFFNRTKDWADLEEMHAAGCLDVTVVLGVLATYLGAGDKRIDRLRTIAMSPPPCAS